jgi:hypothetical protein
LTPVGHCVYNIFADLKFTAQSYWHPAVMLPVPHFDAIAEGITPVEDLSIVYNFATAYPARVHSA